MRWLVLFTIAIALAPATAATRPLPRGTRRSSISPPKRCARIDQAVEQAIKKGDLPGAVVVIVHRGHVVFRKAYGKRGVEAGMGMMQPEIVFDLASLTKPIVTASLHLSSARGGQAATHRSGFAPRAGKPFEDAPITIAHLLTHTSG